MKLRTSFDQKNLELQVGHTQRIALALIWIKSHSSCIFLAVRYRIFALCTATIQASIVVAVLVNDNPNSKTPSKLFAQQHSFASIATRIPGKSVLVF